MTSSAATSARFLSGLLSVGCLFSNFSFFNVGDFPISLALIVMVLLLLGGVISDIRIPPAAAAVASLFLAFVSAYAVVADDRVEAVRSLGQLYLAGAFLFFGVQGLLRARDPEYLASLLVLGFLAHSTLLIAQFIAMNGFGSFALQNPFGRFSPLGPMTAEWDVRRPYLPYFGQWPMRPNGFFSEPSVAAWATAFGLSALLAHPKLFPRGRKLMAATLAAGIFVTFALTGWVMFCIIVGFSILAWVRSEGFSRQIGLLAASVCAMALAILLGGEYLQERAASIGRSGSSIDMRFIAPAKLLAESIIYHPFGHPLGDVSYMLDRRYMVDGAGRHLAELQNGYFWVIYYFGVFGLAAAAWTAWTIIRLLSRKGLLGLPLLSMGLAAAGTGAFFGSQFLLFLAAAVVLLHPSTVDTTPRPDLQPSLRGASALPPLHRRHLSRVDPAPAKELAARKIRH